MKARVDIEIYERWIAEFKGFCSGNFGYYQVDSICEKSEKDLINQTRSYLKTHKKLFLEMIVKERRAKFKIGKEKFDLLIERKEFHRLNSNKPIFKEDDERMEKLWRHNPNIFHI